MDESRIGVGFIGAGAIVRQRHLPGLKQIPGVALVAVANRSRESAERVAAQFGISTVYDDWREVLDDPGVDAVVIGTWPYKHSEFGIAALEAGKHVFTQARLAMDAADARRMAKAAAASGLTTMVSPPPHGMRVEPTVVRYVRAGVLGGLHHVLVRHFTAAFLDPKAPLHWRQVAEFSGLNTLTVGILYEVVGRWFGYAKKVQAVDATFTRDRPLAGGSDSGKVDRPDAVFVLATMESGAIASFLFSGSAGAPGGDSIEAYGSQGSLRYLMDSDRLLMARAPEWEVAEVEVPPEEEGRWRAEEEFIQAIREGRSGHPSWEEGVRYMRFVEAVERAARTGGKISISSV